jgi:hypothetical protein
LATMVEEPMPHRSDRTEVTPVLEDRARLTVA